MKEDGIQNKKEEKGEQGQKPSSCKVAGKGVGKFIPKNYPCEDVYFYIF
jgi:hypothetical protein